MRLRHILEYENHEIRDLMGDLDSVGAMNPYRGVLWARLATHRLMSNRWSSYPEYMCFLETEPIFATGGKSQDESLMLESIQNGTFVRPENPDARSWSSLRSGNKGLIDLLEKRNVQSLARTCSTMGELIEKLREGLVGAQKVALGVSWEKLFGVPWPDNLDAAASVLIYGFIAPEGSPYLDTFDMNEPFEKGDGINHYTR